VDESALRRLAEVGVASLPPDRLPGLIDWCWDRGEVLADVRYCIIARTLEPIHQLFVERGESGGVPAMWLEVIDGELCRRLPSLLDERDIEVASALGRSMRAEIFRLLLMLP